MAATVTFFISNIPERWQAWRHSDFLFSLKNGSYSSIPTQLPKLQSWQPLGTWMTLRMAVMATFSYLIGPKNDSKCNTLRMAALKRFYYLARPKHDNHGNILPIDWQQKRQPWQQIIVYNILSLKNGCQKNVTTWLALRIAAMATFCLARYRGPVISRPDMGFRMPRMNTRIFKRTGNRSTDTKYVPTDVF